MTSRIRPRAIEREWSALPASMRTQDRGLIFANLVDFDTLYGHRNDTTGYAANLESFDRAAGGSAAATARRRLARDHGRPWQRSDALQAPTIHVSTCRYCWRDVGSGQGVGPRHARDVRRPGTDAGRPLQDPRACQRCELLVGDSGTVMTRSSSAPIREQLETREREILAPQSAKSADTKGRLRAENEDPIRPAFQRDRDRIIHTKAFRRLKHKTQVFFSPAGDHYRTRLTHTLEVAQIARTIAKVLAPARGADRGDCAWPRPRPHTRSVTPANACSSKLVPGGFNHYEQSLRIVDVLENNREGLNLTWEVRDGIARHSKGKSGMPVGAPPEHRASTIEGQIARVADIVAYVNHDIDDAIRAGILDEANLPRNAVRSAGPLAVRTNRTNGHRRRSGNDRWGPVRDPHERPGAGSDAGSANLPVLLPSTRTRSRRRNSPRPKASSAGSGRR